MKQLVLIALLFSSTSAFAARSNAGGDNTARAILGFSQSAFALGADYEKHLDGSLGVGGYFLYSSEKKDNAAKNQTISFGGMAPAHFFDDSHWDLFLAPGFGITMVKGIGGASDETAIGPSIKTGLQYKISPTMKLGLEHFYASNWFNDKVLPFLIYTNASLAFQF
jgi:hypothetical protein